MKKRPSDRQLAILRRRHATRAIRETISYGMGWPEKAVLLRAAWEYMIHKGDVPDWYGWLYFLGNANQCPRLSFDPFEPY